MSCVFPKEQDPGEPNQQHDSAHRREPSSAPANTAQTGWKPSITQHRNVRSNPFGLSGYLLPISPHTLRNSQRIAHRVWDSGKNRATRCVLLRTGTKALLKRRAARFYGHEWHCEEL
jgi:hypothetical protein